MVLTKYLKVAGPLTSSPASCLALPPHLPGSPPSHDRLDPPLPVSLSAFSIWPYGLCEYGGGWGEGNKGTKCEEGQGPARTQQEPDGTQKTPCPVAGSRVVPRVTLAVSRAWPGAWPTAPWDTLAPLLSSSVVQTETHF